MENNIINSSFIKTNYHTHSLWCDGKSSVEEMIKAAIEQNIKILGFSSHSIFPFAGDYHLPVQNHQAYCEEVRSLAKKYSKQIKVYCGFESDFIPHLSAPKFEQYKNLKADFLIGSVHYVTNPNGEGYFEADGNPIEQFEAIKKYFKGNKKLAVQSYFASQREMLRHGNFTFLGHPDLIKIRNKTNHLFNENDLWYKKELKALAKEAKKAGICAEINTGGLARGTIDCFYPSPYLLEAFHNEKVPVTAASDAHSADKVGFLLEEACMYAKKAGYTEVMFYTDGSLKSQKI